MAAAMALTTMIAASPATADWQAGMEAFQNKDWSRAEAELRAVVAEQPEWYGGHRMLGQTLLEAGRAEDAIPFLRTAVELKPDDPSGRFTLGRAAAEAGRSELVRSTLRGERPDGLTDDHWRAWLQYRSNAARALGQLGEARRDLEKLIALGATDAETSYLLGYLALQEKDADAALGPLSRARRAAVEDGDRELESRALGLELGVRLNRATSSEAAERQTACQALVKDVRRLLELDPSAADLSRAGRTLGCSGNAAEAAGLLRRAVEAGAQDWRTRYQLARELSFSDRPEQAIAVLEPLLGTELEPQQARSTHGFLGYVLETQQRYAEAIEHYAAAGSEAKVASARESQRIHQEILESEREQAEIERLEEELERLRRAAEEAAGGPRR
ncbi:MAG: tetratricopeptide repeat protein [Holophagales bacterium]|nr:tetratricopeptide repeat protein [Holophagales bacterium]